MKRLILLPITCFLLTALFLGCGDEEELSIIGYWEWEGGSAYSLAFLPDGTLCMRTALADSCLTGIYSCGNREKNPGYEGEHCWVFMHPLPDDRQWEFHIYNLEEDRLNLSHGDSLANPPGEPDFYNRISSSQFPCDCPADTATVAF